MTYHPNPPRKCGGSKQADAFYLEGGEFDTDGALHAWSWLLGDGVDHAIVFSKEEVPPRQVVGIDPVLTILFESYMPVGGPRVPIPEDMLWTRDRLSQATTTPGVADHVGDNFYSPWNFHLETVQYGPSRRVSKAVAKALGDLIAQYGPLPMIFAHSKIPVFRNVDERDEAMRHVYAMTQVSWLDCDEVGPIDQEPVTTPTWLHSNWGMYARRKHWTGTGHYMIPILGVLDDIKERWDEFKDDEVWKKGKKFFKGLRYVKQTFGCSWLCRVSYTLPFEGPADEDAMEIPGINIINLEETGVFDEQETENAPVGAY